MPDGNCRACMVEIKGERVLAPSCWRCAGRRHGSHERQSERAVACAEDDRSNCLLADVPEKLEYTCGQRNSNTGKSHAGQSAAPGLRSAKATWRRTSRIAAMSVNLDACIQCTRCVRACREEQVNDVIGLSRCAAKTFEDRLRPRRSDGEIDMRRVWRMRPGKSRPAHWRPPSDVRILTPTDRTSFESLCPVSAASAASSPINVKGNEDRVRVEGPRRSGQPRPPVREGSVWFRLRRTIRNGSRVPLIRKAGDAPKRSEVEPWIPPIRVDANSSAKRAGKRRWRTGGRQALRKIRDERGPASVRWRALVRPRGSNEEAYLFQKLVRTGFGTNNVDHCTRLVSCVQSVVGAARRHRLGAPCRIR